MATDRPDEDAGALRQQRRRRQPWSERRRRSLLGLAGGGLAGGLGAIALPAQYGVTAGLLALLCGFLLLAAAAAFVLVPGPGTAGTLARSVPLAGAACVVAVLLLLSAPEDVRWLWWSATAATAAWTAGAAWQARRTNV